MKTTFVALLLLALATVSMRAQAPAGSGIPRAADGHPDLTGVYQAGSTRIGTWMEANEGVGVPERTGGAGRIARPTPPYQPWVRERLAEQAKRRNIDGSAARCIPSISFMTTGLFPVEFIQTPNKVMILIEYMSAVRNIPLNVPQPDDHVPTFMGTSVGRWEGDTLVVDSIDFYEQMDGGRIHSDALHVVERFTRTDVNTIKYHVDWDDPKVLTKPDAFDSQFMLRPGTRVREYICNENNEDAANFEKLKQTDLFIRK